MTFNLDIDMDNAAFEDEDAGAELSRILMELADRVHNYHNGDALIGQRFRLRDVNGNNVGEAWVD